MNRCLVSVALVCLGAVGAPAQTPTPERWVLTYDRQTSTQVQMHGPRRAATRTERSRLALVARGDSVTGQLILLATEDGPERLIGDVRGVRRKNELSLNVSTPYQPMGFIAAQWAALMVWMKETMHGIAPTVTRFQLTIAGDEVKGTRTVATVDGANVDGPRPVTGKREKP